MTQILEKTQAAITQALRNGMSFKQIAERIPVYVAKQMGVPVRQFHVQLEAAERNVGFEGMVMRILSSFTPAEQAAIARRK